MQIVCRKYNSRCFTIGKLYTIEEVLPYGVTVIDDDGDGYYLRYRTVNECFEYVGNDYESKGDASMLTIKIKYFDGAKKLEKISKGDWIDLYANKDMIIYEGTRAMIPLGVAMELPEGYEAHLAPRSSTFKTWGLIQTNHVGVIDHSFCGDGDQWHMPVYCLDGKDATDDGIVFTEIHKGDKIAQFRIMEIQPQIVFDEVEVLGNDDRGGLGSTGTK